MRAFIGVTDSDWFEFLRTRPQMDEVNFWQPGGSHLFRALAPGEMFLFKLRSPRNFIVGGGVFAYSWILPISLAWSAFETSNGAQDFVQMREQVARYRKQAASAAGGRFEDHPVGCILLHQPFFLPEDRWVPVPSNWSKNIVQGKTYDLTDEIGKGLWRSVQDARRFSDAAATEPERYGSPQIILPRLGQGSFRVVVTEAYARRCAITNERTLPALDAAHIVPYYREGVHRLENGLLLRKDLHALFDAGYMTVTPDLRVEVSPRIRQEFENGRDYYRLHGSDVRPPVDPQQRPSASSLSWHNENVYRA